MTDPSEDILDYVPKKPKHPRFITYLFVVAIALFLCWLLIPETPQNLYYRQGALILGLFILAINSTLRFLNQSNKSKSSTAIFIGQLFLITGIFVVFTNLPFYNFFIIGAGASFLIGMFLRS